MNSEAVFTDPYNSSKTQSVEMSESVPRLDFTLDPLGDVRINHPDSPTAGIRDYAERSLLAEVSPGRRAWASSVLRPTRLRPRLGLKTRP